jgi:hypothetical protein
VATSKGVDTRRVALRRVNGRWSRRPDFYRSSTCDLVRMFKAERPVFGGRTNRALQLAFQASSAARAQVTVLRGSKVVKRFAAQNVRARRTVRKRLDATSLARGTYRVQLRLTRPGARAVTSVLSVQRL